MNVETVRLKTVASVRVSNVDKKSYEGGIPVRLCNYTDVYYADRINNDREFMRATATPDQVATFRLRRGQTLITKDSETADDIGVPAFVDTEAEDLVCGYHLAQITPDPDAIDPRFLYWSIASQSSQEQFSLAASGVTRFGLRTDAITCLTLAMPPHEQQRRIADFLDAETARIDALVTAKRQMIDLQAARVRRSVSDLLGMANGSDLSVVGCPLRYVCQVSGGITLGKSYSGATTSYPYIRVANVQDGFLDLQDVATIDVPSADASRYALVTGDLLVLEGNGNPANLGRGTIWRGEVTGTVLHQNHVHVVRPGPRLLPEYLDLALRTEAAREYITGGTNQVSIATLSQERLGGMRLPLPSIDDQRGLVWRANDEKSRASSMVDTLTRQIELLRERRQALITAAVSGELTV